MSMMTSVLNTQEATTTETITDILVIVAVSQPSDNQEIAEKKPFKGLKVKAYSSTSPTIHFVDSDLEEDVIASAPVTEEVDQYL